MQATAWNALFRRIPADQHDKLILMTSIGGEIIIQRIIRVDRDFLVAIGRPSGCIDQATVLVIPFDQLTYLSFSKKLNDQEVEMVLGKQSEAGLIEEDQVPTVVALPTQPTALPEQTMVTAPSEQPAHCPVQPPVPEFAPAAEAAKPAPTPPANPPAAPPRTLKPGDQPPPVKLNPKMGPPSKSTLLARLRQRLSQDISKPVEQ